MFQKGHKLAPGGPRPNSGRPNGKQLKEIEKAATGARLKLEKCLSDIESAYVSMALDKMHERSTIHAMENYVKPVSHEPATLPAVYTFIQFNNNSTRLPAEGLSSPVLGGNDSGEEEARGDDMAQEVRQGQDGIEFRSFANVSRERR